MKWERKTSQNRSQSDANLCSEPRRQFPWRPASRLLFLQWCICNQRLICRQWNYWKSVFWPARIEQMEKYLDNSDLLKTEIAYNASIFTAVTRNHGNGQKSRHTAKITVITAIVNSWFSYSPSDDPQSAPSHLLAIIEPLTGRRLQDGAALPALLIVNIVHRRDYPECHTT